MHRQHGMSHWSLMHDCHCCALTLMMMSWTNRHWWMVRGMRCGQQSGATMRDEWDEMTGDVRRMRMMMTMLMLMTMMMVWVNFLYHTPYCPLHPHPTHWSRIDAMHMADHGCCLNGGCGGSHYENENDEDEKDETAAADDDDDDHHPYVHLCSSSGIRMLLSLSYSLHAHHHGRVHHPGEDSSVSCVVWNRYRQRARLVR